MNKGLRKKNDELDLKTALGFIKRMVCLVFNIYTQ